MIKLYLVRHGESTYNAENRVQGHQNPPLSVLGLRQAEALADRLAREKFDAVYSSDLARSSATAEVIALRHGLPVVTSELLREANLGVIEGLTRAEIDERFPAVRNEWRQGALTARPPGGETIFQVIDRCRGFLREMVREREELSAVIVGHGGSMRGLVIAALDLPSDAYHKLRFSNASLSTIELSDRSELRLLNDACHLDTLRTDEETDSVA